MGHGWDDRQVRTRADVLVAAGELIAAGGVEGLSMRKLADRAGVAVATLYNQFGLELYEALMRSKTYLAIDPPVRKSRKK
jgi:AcrR family transcriptional regulator